MFPTDDDIEQLLTEAENLLQELKPNDALQVLERARRLEPRHAWMLLFRGVALAQLGQVEEAVKELLSAADEHPEDVDIQVDAARHLCLIEEYQDALICADRALAHAQDDAMAHAVRGEALEHLGRLAQAVPEREEALALDPTDSDNRYSLAVGLCDLGRYPQALEVATPLFAEFPDDPDILRLHGACLSYLGRHAEAMGKWAELERLEGVTPNLLHNRASTLDALGRFEEALTTIEEAIDLEPELAVNFYTRGMIHEHQGEEAPALQDYLEALSIDPNHLETAMNLVEVAPLVSAGDLSDAQARLHVLMGDHPRAAVLRYAAGRLQLEAGEFAAAMKLLESAVRCDPALGVGWYTLSMISGMMGNFATAVASADRALRFFPDDVSLWLNRAKALQELKRYPEAMEAYDRAIQLAPQEHLAWLQLGRLLLLDLDRVADARGALKMAARLAPEDDNVTWLLALCALRLGREDEAGDAIARLLAKDPHHLWGRLLNAMYHSQQGQLDAAFADLDIVAEHGYDLSVLSAEPLFGPLRADPRFAMVFAKAK
jgi:tetratricopeptide (TPR) repeat protein